MRGVVNTKKIAKVYIWCLTNYLDFHFKLILYIYIYIYLDDAEKITSEPHGFRTLETTPAQQKVKTS